MTDFPCHDIMKIFTSKLPKSRPKFFTSKFLNSRLKFSHEKLSAAKTKTMAYLNQLTKLKKK